jgi:hypothetical protein
MARNQSNIQGLVPQPQDTDTSTGNNRSRWYKPTWYTVTTELGVGIGAGATLIRYLWEEKMSTTRVGFALCVPTIASALLAGEVARAVTTRLDKGAVGGGLAGIVSGALTGAMTGATVFTTVISIISILDGKFNEPFNAIILGGVGGAIIGGIAGLLTGLETGYFAKRPKNSIIRNKALTKQPTPQQQKITPKLKQEEQKHKPA